MLKTFLLLLAHFGQMYCCDERDCKPAVADEIRQTSRGIEVLDPSGWHAIPHNWAHFHPSGDGQIWICRTDDGYVRCLFIPTLS